MKRELIYAAIESEREHQDKKWGLDFHSNYTPNEWIAYGVHYLGQALTPSWNKHNFRLAMLKVATLCVAALEKEDYVEEYD